MSQLRNLSSQVRCFVLAKESFSASVSQVRCCSLSKTHHQWHLVVNGCMCLLCSSAHRCTPRVCAHRVAQSVNLCKLVQVRRATICVLLVKCWKVSSNQETPPNPPAPCVIESPFSQVAMCKCWYLYDSKCMIPPVAETTFVSRLVCVLLSFVGGRLCGACCGPPVAFPVGHQCTVGVLAGTHRCAHRVQGGSVAKRQPFFVWLLVLLES